MANTRGSDRGPGTAMDIVGASDAWAWSTVAVACQVSGRGAALARSIPGADPWVAVPSAADVLHQEGGPLEAQRRGLVARPGVDGGSGRFVGLPLDGDRGSGAHRDLGLDHGRVRRERAGEASGLLPGHRAGAVDEDGDVLVVAADGRPEIGVGPDHCETARAW